MLGKDVFLPDCSEKQANCLIGIYHSNSWQRSKDRVLKELKATKGVKRVLIATTALCMGVNFPDVRFVINWTRHIPKRFQDFSGMNIYCWTLSFIIELLFQNEHLLLNINFSLIVWSQDDRFVMLYVFFFCKEGKECRQKTFETTLSFG